MSVEHPDRVSLALALKAWRRILVFRGRSTRTELVSYALVTAMVVWPFWIATHLLDIDIRIDPVVPFGAAFSQTILVLVLEALPILPVFALVARRAHDHDRPGWPFVIIAMAILPLSIWRDLYFRTVNVDLPPDWLGWVRGVCGIIFYAGLLWTPTIGPNRYGPNPRLPDAEPQPGAA